MEEKNQIESMMEGVAERLTKLVDTDTIVGKPIFSVSGAQLIPIAKVTMGYLSGGGEYGEVKVIKEGGSAPFGGAAGTVVSMNPIGFLIDDGKGCRIVQLGDSPLDRVIEKAGELISQISEKHARS